MIEFFVKKGIALIEIYNEIANVLGDAVPSKTMVCKWALEFNVVIRALQMIHAVDAQKVQQLQISLN